MNTDHLALPEAGRSRNEPSAAGRRFGYTVAIAINAGLLYVVNNLLDWDWLPFLTEAWDDVLPIIRVSLVAAMIVNAGYILFDHKWFKSLTQIGLAGISMAATVRIYQVFPFDFTQYDFGWETLTKAILIIAMVGVGISVLVETGKLIRAISRA